MLLLPNAPKRRRTSGNGRSRRMTGKRKPGGVSVGGPPSFKSPSSISPPSQRHARYSNTAQRSSADKIPVRETSLANSRSDIVGKRMCDRMVPRTSRWFSGVSGRFRRSHSFLLQVRHDRNNVSSVTDRLGNLTMFSSALTTNKNEVTKTIKKIVNYLTVSTGLLSSVIMFQRCCACM